MILCGLVGFLFTMGPASFENWLVWSLEVDGMKEAYWVCKPHSVPDVNVSRAMIAGTWVAFFQRVPAMIVRTGHLVRVGLGRGRHLFKTSRTVHLFRCQRLERERLRLPARIRECSNGRLDLCLLPRL